MHTTFLRFCIKLLIPTTHTLLQSLHYEEANSTGIGAAVAEKTLKVTERFLQEASSEAPVLVRTPSHDSTDVSSSSYYSL